MILQLVKDACAKGTDRASAIIGVRTRWPGQAMTWRTLQDPQLLGPDLRPR